MPKNVVRREAWGARRWANSVGKSPAVAKSQTTGKQFLPKQINHARSIKNTLRGIHVAEWNKIIYVTKGEVQVVTVDCRQESPTFGKYDSIILGDTNRSCIFIPAGFGNSYLVLSNEANYVYVTDQEWSPNKEKDIIWNDKALNIKWMLKDKPFLSERDKNGSTLFSVFPKIK